ncbi:MAG TPA: hypothetical protein VGJ05_19690 [Fimbriiglobus sp.]
MRTQLAMVHSRPVLRDALKDEKLRTLPTLAQEADPTGWLEKELTVQQIDGTDLIRLSLSAREHSSDLAPILNAVVKSYLATVDRLEGSSQQEHLNELKKVYDGAESKVRELRQALSDLTRNLKGADSQVMTLKQKTLIDEYSALKRELAGIDTRRRELEIKLSRYRLRLASGVKSVAATGGADAVAVDVLVERDVDVDPEVKIQQANVAILQNLLAITKERVTDPQHFTVVKCQNDLDAANRKLQALRAERRATLTARYQSANRATAEYAVHEVEDELKLLNGQHDTVMSEWKARKEEVDKLGLDSVEFELKRADLDRNEVFVKSIWEQKERLEVELTASNRQRVSVLSAPEDAIVMNKTLRLQEAAGAGMAGMLVGLLGISIWKARKSTILQVTDVTQGLRLPVMGTLPKLKPSPLRRRLHKAINPQDETDPAFTEAIDAVRTRLMNTRFGTQCPVLMIASSSPGEGKTTLTTQLGLSLARAGLRTLLVDSDLRCPSLHRTFGVDLSPGVCEKLADPNVATAPVHQVGNSGLFVMTAGEYCPQAASGLAGWDVYEMLVGLREQYDFILLDSSPLLLVPDGSMVGRFVDGVLFSVRPGVSHTADVFAGYEQSCENRLPFIGVVVNGVHNKRSYYPGYVDRPRRPGSGENRPIALKPAPIV